MLLLLEHFYVKLLSVDPCSIGIWVCFLGPVHVIAIHESISGYLYLETSFSFHFLHNLHRVFHKSALLHLIFLNLQAVAHDLSRLGWDTLTLSPGGLDLQNLLIFVLFDIFSANESITVFISVLICVLVLTRCFLVDLLSALGARWFFRCSDAGDKIKVFRGKETAQIVHVLRLDVIVDHACGLVDFILQILARRLQAFLLHSTDCRRCVLAISRLR